jgi:predicted nucleic acid-binding protein
VIDALASGQQRSDHIRIPDALIAASAETIQAIVVTRNTSDLQRVPGLTVVHPDNV